MKPHRSIPWITWMLLLLTIVYTGCSEKIEPGTTPEANSVTVKAPVAVARITEEPNYYEAVGTITARTASTISGKLLGTVLQVHVNEGDLVRRDDLLVTLDPRQVTAQLEQVQAGLKEARRAEASAVSAHESARAAAELAAATMTRYKKLLEENTIPRQQYDEVEARHRQAQAALAQTEAMVAAAQSRVQQAEAAVRGATVSRKDAQVRAPYDGRVVDKLINEGDLAAPGTPLLTIEEEGLFCADLVLPERHIQAVQLGDEVRVKVPALDNLEVAGTVGRIIPSADARSRSFELKVAMPEGLDLKSGMFARVFIPLGRTGMLLIPQTAIRQEGQLEGVYVVDDKQTAHLQLIRTGKTYGERVEIVSGLAEGQRYVNEIKGDMTAGVKVEAVQ